ncbi:hypothetical protein B0J14DRAFT_703589 [Halenospora varia]|nr:hypothetical protein B0J14DRAFT_703589 [Halenospora varia]
MESKCSNPPPIRLTLQFSTSDTINLSIGLAAAIAAIAALIVTIWKKRTPDINHRQTDVELQTLVTSIEEEREIILKTLDLVSRHILRRRNV